MEFNPENSESRHIVQVRTSIDERETIRFALTDKICRTLASTDEEAGLEQISDKELELSMFSGKLALSITAQQLIDLAHALEDFRDDTNVVVREQVQTRAKHHYYLAEYIPRRIYLGRTVADKMRIKIYGELFDMHRPDENDMPEAEFIFQPANSQPRPAATTERKKLPPAPPV